MSRKTILFLIILFFFIGAGFLLYNLTKKPEAPAAPTPNQISNPFGNFFPDVSPVNTDTTVADNNNTPETIQFFQPINRLQKISETPIAGGTVFDRGGVGSTTTSSTVYRYVDRATGHVYERSASNSQTSRISNVTVPMIYRALFLENKNSVIYQYLDKNNQIETYAATITSTSTPDGQITSTLGGVFMQKNIDSIVISPDQKNTFTLTMTADSASSTRVLGQIAPANNSGSKVTLFRSPISGWVSDWFSKDRISITTKSSYMAQGIMYFINTQSGAQEKILGPFFGLTTKTSPHGKKVVYSRSEGGAIKFSFYTADSDISKSLPVATLAEKCVWSKDNINVFCAIPTSMSSETLPDDWYLGLTSFNDSIVKIDTELERVTTLMSANSLTPEDIDAFNLQLSPKEDFLVFTNKRDLSFWSLDIKQD